MSAVHPSTVFIIELLAWHHRMYGMYYVRWRIIIIFVDVLRDMTMSTVHPSILFIIELLADIN